jgi:arabinofuranosyltransferase
MISIRSSEPCRSLLICFVVLFFLLSAASVAAVLKYDRFGTGIDDANIYFVYARNLIEGFGLVYNRGGERVEGYTSPLWMLICAGAFWFTGSSQRLLLLNFVLLLFSLCYLLSSLSRYLSRRYCSLLCLFLALWIGGNPDYVGWTIVSLLETGLWSAILIISTMMVVKDRQDTVIQIRRRSFFFLAFLFILVFSRPESLVWGPFFVLIRSLILLRNSRYSFRFVQDLCIPLGIFALAVLALVGFRLSYFGFPLPNTYYAKVSDDRFYNIFEGGKYLARFLLCSPGSSLAFFIVALILVLNREVLIRELYKGSERVDVLLLLGLTLVFHLLVPLAIGGDHFAQFRQYQPLLPLLPALLTITLTISWSSEKLFSSKWLVSLVASLLVLLVAGNRARWYDKDLTLHIDGEFVLARRDFTRSQLLNKFFQPLPQLPRIGQIAAGAIQLGYHGHIIDLMGLNNTAMAHAPGEKKGLKNHAAFNKAVFFQQMPELFFVSFSESQYIQDPMSWGAIAMKGLFFERQFQELYSPVVIRSPHQVPLFAYIRNDYRSELLATGFTFEDGTLPFGQRLDGAVTLLG